MKKIITTIIICMIAILGIYTIKQNPEWLEKSVNKIKDIYDKITGNEYIPYSEELKVNRLQVQNARRHYDLLTDNQKTIYANFAVAIKELSPIVTLKKYQYIDDNTTQVDVEKAMQYFLNDHPEVFYLNNKYTISTRKSAFGTNIEVGVKYSVENINDLEVQMSKVEDEIDKLVEKVIGMEKIDAEIYLHDELASMTTYYEYENIEDVPLNQHSIYGALIEKSAVCDGFAKAMQLLLQRIGMESILVSGTLEGSSHAWNMVKLNDKWYHLDVTSNKSIHNQESDSRHTIHSYFNITTKQILQTHSIDAIETLPQADSTDYDYYRYTNQYIAKTDIFATKLEQILSKNTNPYLVEFKVEENLDVSSKMIRVFQTQQYSNYLSNNRTRITYYNLLDTYIVVKNEG